MRKDFQMTDEQLEKIMDACKPVPMIMLHLGMPVSPQENANNAWKALGEELGFKHMTVKPGSSNKLFSAEVDCDNVKSELLTQLGNDLNPNQEI